MNTPEGDGRNSGALEPQKEPINDINYWPGSGPPPLVSYGYNMWLNIDGYELHSRQNNLDLKLQPSKLLELSANNIRRPRAPVNIRRLTEFDHLEELDLRYFPPDIVRTFEQESATLERWDVFDPSVGQRLAWHDRRLLWGDGSLLHTWKHDKLVDTLDVGSPILQLEPQLAGASASADLLLRTRQGLGVLRNEDVHPLFDGDTMHVARGLAHTSLCLKDGGVHLYNPDGVQTFAANLPRTPSGWAKTCWLEPNLMLYMSRDLCQTMDPREPPSSPQGSQGAGWTSLLRTPKTQVFRDMTASGNDIFILEDYFLAWWDKRMLKGPLLWSEHHLDQAEPSWRLGVTREFGDASVVISSCAQPQSLVMTFGPDYDYPVSKLDPYVLDFYPNVHPQSQLWRQGARYIASTTGGLYKQEFGEQESSDSLGDDFGEPLIEETPPRTNDFRWRNWSERGSFEIKFKSEMLSTAEPQRVLRDLDKSMSQALDAQYLENNRCAEIGQFRRLFVDHIKHDLAARVPQKAVMELDEGTIDSKLMDLMADWPDPLEVPEEVPSSMAEVPTSMASSPMRPPMAFSQMAPPAFSQMAQPKVNFGSSQVPRLAMASSQPEHDHISFSQPLPGPSKAPKKPKKKKKRVRDGFA